MLAIKNILFPIDFSERCCGAAPFVRAMAERFGARITLMSVVSPFWQAAYGDPSSATLMDIDEFRRDSEARLKVACVKDFAGLAVDRVAEIGDPAESITSYAHTQGADLITMPIMVMGPSAACCWDRLRPKYCTTHSVRYGPPPTWRTSRPCGTWPDAMFCAP